MDLLPIFLLFALVLLLLWTITKNRKRAMDEEIRLRSVIQVGTEVMTTAGLYATVVSLDEYEDTAMLSVAPGVEVKWAFAALRDVNSLPKRYRPGASAPEEAPGEDG